MSEQQNSLTTYARRMGQHMGVYTGGHIAVFFFAMTNVAVLTRVLSLDEYGYLAVYLVFAGMLTVIYNLGTLQGVLISVYGAADDEEGVLVEEDDDEGVEDKGRALTTGVLLTIAIAALGTIAVLSAAPLFVGLLGVPEADSAVRLAALCGATGAVWRLVHNVMRLERRPVAFSVLGIVRPAFALVAGVSLVLAGYGIEGVLAGIALGTALAIPVAVVATHRSYALGVDVGALAPVLRHGARIVPFIVAMWVIHNVDLLFVNAYAPAEDVGPYRVAMRLGAGVSYAVSAVTMSWLPLTRIPLHQAMAQDHGKTGFGGTMLTAFLLFCMWLLLGLTLLANALIRIAPESYAGAAPLVPLIGLGIVAFGVFIVIFRGSSFPNRGQYRLGLTLAALAIFLALSWLLVPRIAGYGAAAAQIAGFTFAAAVMLWRAQRSEDPLPIQYGRLGRGVAVGLLCIAFGQLVSPLAGDARIFIDLGLLTAFPFLLVLARAFPREEWRAFVDFSLPDSPRRRAAELLAKVEKLDPLDRRTVSMLVPKGSSPTIASREIGAPEPEIMTRFVASLRTLAPHDRDGPDDADQEIAAYLLADGGVASRDRLGRRLCKNGVDPFELDVLDVTLVRLRRIPQREWERMS